MAGSLYGSESTRDLGEAAFPFLSSVETNQNVFFPFARVGICWTPGLRLLFPLTGNGKRASKAQSHRAARSVRGCCAPPARYRLKWELGSDEAARSENLSLPLKHPSPLTLKAEVFQVIFFFF